MSNLQPGLKGQHNRAQRPAGDGGHLGFRPPRSPGYKCLSDAPSPETGERETLSLEVLLLTGTATAQSESPGLAVLIMVPS